MGILEIDSNDEKQNNIWDSDKTLKIMIFTEGTIIGPKDVFHLFNHAAYIPIGKAAFKTKDWRQQRVEIIYLTSRKKLKHLQQIKDILIKGGFAPGVLYYREGKEKYRDIVEFIKPDILVEDDCKSIGGKWQMSITYVNPELKQKIKSIVVKEFRGIDHLASRLSELLNLDIEGCKRSN